MMKREDKLWVINLTLSSIGLTLATALKHWLDTIVFVILFCFILYEGLKR